MNNMAARFPRLRWGFIEASAQWLPWIANEVKHRNVIGRNGEEAAVERNPLHGSNVYVTCQNEDDIPYLLKEGFEDNLVVGTDFGHFDASSDVDAISKFIQNEEIGEEAKTKILYHNPKALYNL
jgi:predicted TIM-barrel fold metal-dependent hydrolase